MATLDLSQWTRARTSQGYLQFDGKYPCDDRLVYQTKQDALNSTRGRRYPGLKIFIAGDDTENIVEKEWWFKSGVSNSDLVPYRPWANDTEFRQTIEQNVINNIGGSSGGVGGVSLTPYKITASEVADKNDVPTYLNNLIDTSTAEKQEQWKGAEINVVYTDNNGVESFMKYVYLDGGWRMSCGSQAITFKIDSYDPENWAGWTMAPRTGFVYAKDEAPGSVTLCIRHNFATQYVDATLYLTGSGNLDGDNNLDAFGEEVVVAKKCTQMSDPNYPGYWVCLEFFVPVTPQDSNTIEYEYTLLLQR